LGRLIDWFYEAMTEKGIMREDGETVTCDPCPPGGN
jgi:hypothetical protein